MPDCPSPPLSAMLVAVVTIPVALNVIGLPTSPAAVASSAFRPGLTARVQPVTRAIPDESVVAVGGVTVPRNAPVSVNVTDAPGIALPYWSTTRTTGGVLTGWPAIDVCVSMLTRSSRAATSRAPLAVNVTGLPVRPLVLAVSVFCPTSVPSCQPPTRATPAVSVTADPPVTLPLPEAVAKRTPTPDTGLLNWSRTVTAGATGKIVFTTAV